jgi:hypothetical protein
MALYLPWQGAWWGRASPWLPQWRAVKIDNNIRSENFLMRDRLTVDAFVNEKTKN